MNNQATTAKSKMEVFLMKLRSGALSEWESIQTREAAILQALQIEDFWKDRRRERIEVTKLLHQSIVANAFAKNLDLITTEIARAKAIPDDKTAAILLAMIDVTFDSANELSEKLCAAVNKHVTPFLEANIAAKEPKQ